MPKGTNKQYTKSLPNVKNTQNYAGNWEGVVSKTDLNKEP